MIIKVNDKIIDYDGDLAFSLNSPTFYDIISYSLQFSVEDSDVNKEIFGFINLPYIAENKTKELSAQITYGPLVFSGSIVVTWQGGAFNCYFKVDGDFWSSIKNAPLSSINFDKTEFENPLDYGEISTFIEDYIDDDNNQPFTFPYIVNKSIGTKFEVKTKFAEVINGLNLLTGTYQVAVIPFLHLYYIVQNIFEKNGLHINKNAFNNTFLKRLIVGNNFMINDFALDTTELSSVNWFIQDVANSTDPEVTTTEPHTLTNYQFIKLGHLSPEMAVDNRIFQVELIYDNNGFFDEYKFKLIGADFSAFMPYSRNYMKPSSIEKSPNPGSVDRLFFTVESWTGSTSIAEFYYMHSDDWSGIIGVGYDEASGLGIGFINSHITNPDHVIINDPDFATHTYGHCSLLKISDYHNDKISSYAGVVIHDDYYNSILEGTLIKLPSMLINSFKKIDPANHVPNMAISQLLTDLKTIGIETFVNKTSADIVLMKDILTSTDFIDISEYSAVFGDIDNPNKDGYYLKFTPDGNDEFYKKKLPIQIIDEKKYTIKDAVALKSDLSPTDAKTNDVRLVNADKTYYVFNKSFLNVDNNWDFLCLNRLDIKKGNGDVKKETKLSPTLRSDFAFSYDQMEMPCSSINFSSEISMNLRLLSYYNITGPGYSIPYATSDIYNMQGAELPNAGLAIKWEGDKSIYDLLLKEVIDWELNTRKDCKSIIEWPIYLLSDFDFSKKYRIRGIDYLVKSIKFTITKKGIKFNETELVKV